MQLALHHGVAMHSQSCMTSIPNIRIWHKQVAWQLTVCVGLIAGRALCLSVCVPRVQPGAVLPQQELQVHHLLLSERQSRHLSVL